MTPKGTRILSVVVYLLSTARSACPPKCTCSREIVDCHGAGLQRVPWDLPEPGAIKQLLLGNNRITEVIAEIVSYVNLEELDLSNNELSSIDDNVFTSLPKLKVLNIGGNRLRDVNRNTFEGLQSLILLNAEDNKLVLLVDNTFASLTSLEELRLQGNNIEEIGDMAFAGLALLHTLNLEDNLLRSIPDRSFRNLANLEHLNLNHNRVETLSSYSFRDLHNLLTLSMENNGLLEVSEYAFRGESAAYAPQIRTLSLKANKLGDIPAGAFSFLSSLRTVDLSQNPLSKINAYAFENTKQLENVYINSMPELKVIEDYAFAELPLLESVEMHSNHKLVTIEEKAFLATPSLRRVDMHADALFTLSPNTFTWDALTFLDLRYNNWLCDCHLQWMREALLLSTNSTRFLSPEVRCKTPSYLASRPIHEVRPEQFAACTNGHGEHERETDRLRVEQFEDRILIAIIGGIVSILLVTMVVLMCRYRNRICNSPPTEANYQFYNAYRNRLHLESVAEADAESHKDEESVALAGDTSGLASN